jgi:ferritin-like metal-binding protein YciE
MNLGSLEDVYANQLGALRNVQAQLRDALPEIVDAASDTKLTRAFSERLDRTERQLERLDEVVRSSPVDVPEETSEAMRGLISEVRQIIGADGPGEVKDVALIAAAQRIGHHEIASYGTARALADQLDLRSAVDLLGETLDEEAKADELLTKLATGGLIVGGLNERAQD